MNYIINIKTRDLIVCGIIVVAVTNYIEKKARKAFTDFKNAKKCDCELEDDYIYCPVCGKKIKDEES